MNFHTKVMGARVLVREPGPDEMKLINGFAKKELRPEDVYVAAMHLANDQIDRTFERFPISYLQQFAETIVGKSLLIGHNHKGAPEGLFFKADLAKEGGVAHLRPYFYIVKTRQNEHLRAQIDGGVYRYVSIGFHYEDLACDICAKSIFDRDCPHVPGREYEGIVCTATYSGKAEAVEGSIVYLGAQYGAELKKAHEDRDTRRLSALKGEDQGLETEDGRMKTEDRRSGIGEPASPASIDKSMHSIPDEEVVANLRVSFDVANRLLVEEKERARRLEPLARDGRRYRAQLHAEILRLSACVDRATEGRIVAEALIDADAETIEQVLADYQKLFDQKYPPRPHSIPSPAIATADPDPSEYE